MRRDPHFLDWANQPEPFRHYTGVPVLDLPADPPLHNRIGNGAEFLSALFYYSCSISASKLAPSGARYALRVNPSSGNLHPTEFHFLTRGLRHWPDGCYHYRVSSHMAEQRGRGDCVTGLTGAPLAVLLSSIAWREAWKYRSRAYRYVNHDIGHAWQALALCAAHLGCATRARGLFADSLLASRFGLPDGEWPMLLVEFNGPGLPLEQRDQAPAEWLGGTPNRLSGEQVEYPLIDGIHESSSSVAAPDSSAHEMQTADISAYPRFAEVARRRRSALNFIGGERTISLDQLQTLLRCAAQPFSTDWQSRWIRLFLFVHRVRGLAPGLYTHDLRLVKPGDQRVAAAGLSLGQDLAGNSCVTFSMTADLASARAGHGDRAYRFVHWEAGAIGQRLYLASEAMGFRSTGIGAFYDADAHYYLGLARDERVIYHFACGHAVRDPRLDA